MTVQEARQAYDAASGGQSEESQEWAYLRWRLLAGDTEEAVAAANSMRAAHGIPPISDGLSHHWWAMSTAQALSSGSRA